MYADYNFYTNEYFGNVISQQDFPRFEDKASDKLYYLTMGRIDKFLVPNVNGKLELDGSKTSSLIKKSVCKLAEIMYDMEQSEIAYRKTVTQAQATGMVTSGAVASVTSGSESVSYFNTSSSNSTISTIVNADAKTQEQYFYDSIRIYLGLTGLLSQALF